MMKFELLIILFPLLIIRQQGVVETQNLDRPVMDEDMELHDFVDSQSWLFFEVTYIYIYITF
jgi:hypothetical protein